jgi:hypothetical protein
MVYRPRRPEKTVVYQLVQEHLEIWLARVREADPDGDPIPHFVEQDLRKYLACGILAHGFARAHCGGCGHDFLIAYYCKGRGICPSCNTRRMAETAAHLVDHVFPQVPVRQWVLSLPKRLRYFLHQDPALIGPVLRIFLDAVEEWLKASSPGAPAPARFGAVTFVHRFGSALNANLHFHCAIIDGVFSAQREGVGFYEATALGQEDVAVVQRAVRQRVLRLFERRGPLAPETAAEMRQWDHGGGFSLDAAVRIEATDRKGLERLLRYCARPIFASERLLWVQPAERRGPGRALPAAPRQRLIYTGHGHKSPL